MPRRMIPPPELRNALTKASSTLLGTRFLLNSTFDPSPREIRSFMPSSERSNIIFSSEPITILVGGDIKCFPREILELLTQGAVGKKKSTNSWHQAPTL